MNLETFRQYCLSFNGATEDFPFDESTLVFKVKGKMFALTNIDRFESINLKCKPEDCIELRERFDAISPGHHMNKKHWITVATKTNIPNNLLKELIQNSYHLVVQNIPKKLREELEKR
ncbi:protein of unknown function DUF419 [Chloroherpeton thalassium ATCC 35110]|uniref:MmcQ-like protein n=1 Tax=Chloroherpeton thalassium (strain ATCC 35110 / GB-78) TaxID=517418 RepID=B3QW01_CHLT3|nr:MmcQ/YjbR family DNA-binding protein [Chloroherpeton thalassium]ACF14655.1 protein of unknown function DUF419 [Chloroherpeton thalassium ATCC 35110]